ncbi:LacI family DNA-binding transcriptional regulator [Lachnospiraceae bacterium LCP25S3_G4]
METITIKDIAQKCGVGVSTVSRALNNHPDISKETREKIMKIVEENNFVPNNSARNLKRTASKTIAILVKAIDNPFFSKMIRVFEKEINKEKYSFFLQHIDNNQDEVEVAIQLVKEKKLKGIVFLGGCFSHSEEKIRQLTVPFVLSTVGIMDTTEESLSTSVSVDDKKESYRITNYLCSLGHKKIAILTATEEDESIGLLRLEGYCEALKANHIEVNERLIYHMTDEYEAYSMRSGYEMTKQLLACGEEFTAIFAISDMVAIGACKAIFDSGKRIPEDYSIAGFDGLRNTFYFNPSITTIKQPVEEIAQESIRSLFSMITKKKKVPSKVFEGELLERESTRSIYE